MHFSSSPDGAIAHPMATNRPLDFPGHGKCPDLGSLRFELSSFVSEKANYRFDPFDHGLGFLGSNRTRYFW
jgi:hypothetical protein